MPGHSRKAEIKPSVKGIARALNSSRDVVQEPLPDKLAALSERLTESGHQDDSTSKLGIGRVQPTHRSAKSAAELESMMIGLATEPNATDRILPRRPTAWAPVPGALE